MVDSDTAGLGDDLEAKWRGYRASLAGLAGAGAGSERVRLRRQEAAEELLRDVDELLFLASFQAQERLRKQLGRGLVAMGYGRLWPALYALTDCAPAAEIGAGQAEAFLAEPDDDGVPLPPPPPDWPGRWTPPAGPEGPVAITITGALPRSILRFDV
jgi:hypothetical protein